MKDIKSKHLEKTKPKVADKKRSSMVSIDILFWSVIWNLEFVFISCWFLVLDRGDIWSWWITLDIAASIHSSFKRWNIQMFFVKKKHVYAFRWSKKTLEFFGSSYYDKIATVMDRQNPQGNSKYLNSKHLFWTLPLWSPMQNRPEAQDTCQQI